MEIGSNRTSLGHGVFEEVVPLISMKLIATKSNVLLLVIALFLFVTASAFSYAQESKDPAPKPGNPPAAAAGREYSGMYSFLEDGEFVQITVEEEGKVSGYISRYGEGGSEKGTFLEHSFRSGKLDGNRLIFTTATVQGVWFEFKGGVERGEGKKPGDEAYYVLKGTLTDNTSDASKKVTAHSRDVLFKIFPEETRN
jgi:hypothetical protein